MREFRHIGSVFIYLINTVTGIIMLTLACVATLISSAGANKEAKRAATAHLTFNYFIN